MPKALDLSPVLARIGQIGQKVIESNGAVRAQVSKMLKEVAAAREGKVPCGGAEAAKEVKELMQYVRCSVMREVQLIKNLSNDIHKKSEQLPHVVARSADLRKFEL